MSIVEFFLRVSLVIFASATITSGLVYGQQDRTTSTKHKLFERDVRPVFHEKRINDNALFPGNINIPEPTDEKVESVGFPKEQESFWSDQTLAQATPPQVNNVDFQRDVLPILSTHCFDCHEGSNPVSGIRLDYRDKLLGKTDGIAFVHPGKSDESPLIKLVTASGEERMPPEDAGEPLSAEQIDILRAWIDQGVAWDHQQYPDPFAIRTEHWAYQPIPLPSVPQVTNKGWIRNPIDAFVLEKLEANGINPSQTAAHTTLIRRLSLNLIGLPPSEEEAKRFAEDLSANAYEQLVDRLLASPDYGVRWGRHWLDVARFAESQGYVENHEWPHIWRYRDWVISSFNADLPYDEFVTMQIAGDELTPYRDENVVATGFLATARLAGEELSCVRQENDMYVDMVNATSSAFLGLTMACAQCHDHKFDPISQRDYYRLQAFFINGYPGNLVLNSSSSVSEEYRETAEELREHTLSIRNRILNKAYDEEEQTSVRKIMTMATGMRSPVQEATYRVTRASLNIRLAGCNGYRILDSEKKQTEKLTAQLEKEKAKVAQTWGFYSPVTSPHAVTVLPMASNFPLVHDPVNLSERKAYLLRRGDPYNTAFEVNPDWPEILQLQTHSSSDTADHTRIDLARWLTSSDHPLTARVWVNRIWHYHFGRGLVTTPGNFGVRGSKPTHQHLLDFLAHELIQSGWSTKHIQRLILLSNTYRQSSERSEDAMRIDPQNHFYWRWPSRRMESEAIRDSALFVSQLLDRQMGGPSIPIGEESHRRSVFHFQKRDQPNQLQALFDGPTAMSASCSDRHVSTTSLQSLLLMNGPKAAEYAEALADQLRSRHPENAAIQIEAAFRIALGRTPSPQELDDAKIYLELDEQPTRVHDSLPEDGDPIKHWSNIHKNSDSDIHDATQMIRYRQPVYRTGENGINGRPVVHFAGGPLNQADHLLEIEERESIDLDSSYTILSVVRFADQGVGNQIILMKARNGGMDIGTYSLLRYTYGDMPGHVAIDQNIDGEWGRRIVTSKPIPENRPVLIAARWDGNEITLSVHDEGGEICSDQAELKGTIDTAGTGKLGIGGYQDAFSPSGERLKGDIAEILVYRKPIDSIHLDSVTSYLKNKWLTQKQSDDQELLSFRDSLCLHLDAEVGIVPDTVRPLSPLARLCQVLLNLNEFVYIP